MTAEHLTHGWESDAAESDTLLRRFVLATPEHTTFLAERVGGRTAHGPRTPRRTPASAVFFDNRWCCSRRAVRGLRPVMEELLAFYPPERHFRSAVRLAHWRLASTA